MTPQRIDELMADAERRVVAVLAELPEWHTLARRNIQRRTYGNDTWGASHIASAIGRLKQRGLVVEVRRGVYRLSEAGRHALALVDEMNGGGAA